LRITEVFLGLGSNIGDREANISDAIRRIGQLSTTQLLRTSHFYESAPVGPVEQGPFVNAVVAIATNLAARDLLWNVKEIERIMGRVPSGRWGPRCIDIDVLLYGNERIESAELTVPHMELWNRCFALIPLREVVQDRILRAEIDRQLDLLGDTQSVWRFDPEIPASRG